MTNRTYQLSFRVLPIRDDKRLNPQVTRNESFDFPDLSLSEAFLLDDIVHYHFDLFLLYREQITLSIFDGDRLLQTIDLTPYITLYIDHHGKTWEIPGKYRFTAYDPFELSCTIERDQSELGAELHLHKLINDYPNLFSAAEKERFREYRESYQPQEIGSEFELGSMFE